MIRSAGLADLISTTFEHVCERSLDALGVLRQGSLQGPQEEQSESSSGCDPCDEPGSTLKLDISRLFLPFSSAFVPKTTDLEAPLCPGASSRKDATGPLTPFRAKRHGRLLWQRLHVLASFRLAADWAHLKLEQGVAS